MFKKLKSPCVTYLQITNSCNHNCGHCSNSWRFDDIPSYAMTIPQIDSLIDMFINNEIFTVILTGGEPLIYPDKVIYTIDKLSQNNIDTSLNSNISLLNSNMAIRLKQAGLNNILTSLPSHINEICNKIIGKERAFQNILEGIRIAQNNGINVHVNKVVFNHDYNQLIDYSIFLEKYGIKNICVSVGLPPDHESCLEKYQFSDNQFQELADIILDLKNNSKMNIDLIDPIPLCSLKDMRKYISFARIKCTAGIMGMNIRWDGEVQACPISDPSTYGNIFTDGLSTCWEKLTDWRSGVVLNKHCVDCDYLSLCNGECRISTNIFGSRSFKSEELVNLKNTENDISGIDLTNNLALTLNKSTRMRKEDFGGVINLGGTESSIIDTSAYQFLQLFDRNKTLLLTDLKNKVEIDDNFKFLLNFLVSKNVISVSN